MLVAIEERTEGPQGSPKEGQDEVVNGAALSDAAVADLAQEMCVPDELFRMVIDRYPELNRVLARRYRPAICTASGRR